MSDDGFIEFMLFDVRTRRLLPSHRTASTIQSVERQAANLGEGDQVGNLGWVFGHYDSAAYIVDENGEPQPIAEEHE